MDSILIKEGTTIEVKAYFAEEEIGKINQKIYIHDSRKIKKDDIFYIGYFRYPNYKLYFRIMAESTLIDEKSSVIYVNPKALEKNVIELLLYAIIDDKGTRLDITDENRNKIFDSIDPIIITGLYYEFRKNCTLSFKE